MKKSSDFFLDFWSHFGSILGAFFHHFCLQNHASIGKGDFVKMSFSCRRGAHFQGLRLIQIMKKSIKNRSKNPSLFGSKKGRFGGAILGPFWDQNRINNSIKKINGIFDQFWKGFGPQRGSMWGALLGSGKPPGPSQEAPRRSQGAPRTLPKRSQNAEGRQKGPKLDFRGF